MRIVAISDQHGHLPEIPPCDLLLIAGDICPDKIGAFSAQQHPARQADWFDRVFRPWLDKTAAAHRIAVWGNHDWCGVNYAACNDQPNAAGNALQILMDTGTSVGPVSIWGTPWSSPVMDWAFMKPAMELARIYPTIPDGVGILLSHQPPYGYGDHVLDPARDQFDHRGSRELLSAVDRIKPRLVVCGHIHRGHGRYVRAGIPIYNVSLTDEQGRIAHAPTIIDLPDGG